MKYTEYEKLNDVPDPPEPPPPPPRDTSVHWRSASDPPRPDDFSEYIVWCGSCASPGAYIGLYRPSRGGGGGVWVTAASIMLFPSHWAPLIEVFDPRRLKAP